MAKQSAEVRHLEARQALDEAKATVLQARETLNLIWRQCDNARQEWHGARAYNGPRIDSLQRNLRRHNRAQVAAQRKQLIREIRQTQQAFDLAEQAYERASQELGRLMRIMRDCRAEERLRYESYEKWLIIYTSRNKSWRTFAEKAGVPSEYLDNVKVDVWNGAINLLFGGSDGRPTGPNHGHIAISLDGKKTYQRHPFKPHGPQNYLAVALAS